MKRTRHVVGALVRMTSCGAGCWEREESVALVGSGQSVAVGDVDGDEVDDVVVGTSSGVTAYFGGAAGPGRTAGLVASDREVVIGPAEPSGIDLSGGSVDLGDLDGDGDLDLVVQGRTTYLGGPVPTLATLAGGGAAGFAALAPSAVRGEWLSAGAFVRGPAIGDVDGDGADEVVMAIGHALVGTADLVVYDGLSGGGTASVAVGFIASMAAGDVGGDQRADIVVRSPGLTDHPATVQVYCASGTSFAPCSAPLATGDVSWSGALVVDDVDDDGRADILTLGDRLSVWRGLEPDTSGAVRVGARADHAVVGPSGRPAVEPGTARPDLLIPLNADRAAVSHLDNVTP